MNPFEGMNMETVEAVDYYNRMGCTTLDLEDPKRFSKLRDTLRFMGELPENQRSLFLRRALKTNPEDMLDMAWQFAQLHIKRDEVSKILDEKDKELDAYRQQFVGEGLDPLESDQARKLISERQSISIDRELVDSEISLFDS